MASVLWVGELVVAEAVDIVMKDLTDHKVFVAMKLYAGCLADVGHLVAMDNSFLLVVDH